MSSNCTFLLSTSPCGPHFAGFPVVDPIFVSRLASISNPTPFADQNHGCNASAALTTAVNSMRYQVSWACTEAVWVAIRDYSCPTPPSLDVPLLCPTQATTSVSTYTNVYHSSSCPLVPTPWVQDNKLDLRNQDLSELQAAVISIKNGSCVVAVPGELENCGFIGTNEFNSYCKGVGKTDACCQENGFSADVFLVLDGHVVISNTVFPSPSATPAPIPGSEGLGTPALIGIIVGGVVGLVLIGMIMWLCRTTIARRKTFNALSLSGTGGRRKRPESVRTATTATTATTANTKKIAQRHSYSFELDRRNSNTSSAYPLPVNSYVASPAITNNANNVEFIPILNVPIRTSFNGSVKRGSLTPTPSSPVTDAPTATSPNPTPSITQNRGSPLRKPSLSRSGTNANNTNSNTNAANGNKRVISPLPPSKPSYFIARVQNLFQPTQKDELRLRNVGDVIKVLETFDDNWALGVDVATGARGFFPLVAVQEGSGVPVGSVVVPANMIQEKELDVQEAGGGDKRKSVVSERGSSKNGSSGNGREEEEEEVDPRRVSKRFSSMVDISGVTVVENVVVKVPVVETNEENVVVMCVHSYRAGQHDELTLILGDSIKLVRRFDDGWGLGVSLTTGKKGAFPLACTVEQ
ncbi:UNVERIFIED_CONTAM: hypothetical protein HDU68_009642 [Siphonaria sp. JEL0065]|nr:hypothetical protein HDU68_009642 [Siphonaria sp. JEL0065]